MGIRNTLKNIVGSTAVLCSVLMSSPHESYAQKTKPYKPEHVLEISPQKAEASKEIPVTLFQYQQHTQKVVPMGKTVLPIEAEMDYQTGQFNIRYSSGRMTDDGPDLSGFSRRERERIPGAQLVPRLNDEHTFAVVVSSFNKGVEVRYRGQKGWLVGAKENPVRLVPSDRKTEDKIFLWAGNEGLDYLVELGVAKISGGLTEGWDELVERAGAPDEYKVNASERIRNFLEGTLSREKEILRKRAESSLVMGVSLGVLNLYKDPQLGLGSRQVVARSVELELENKTLSDQEVVLYFNRIRLGDQALQDRLSGTSVGSKFGDVRDVEIRVKLPRKKVAESLYSHWKGEEREMYILKNPPLIWIMHGTRVSPCQATDYQIRDRWSRYTAILDGKGRIELDRVGMWLYSEESVILENLTQQRVTQIEEDFRGLEIRGDFSRAEGSFTNTPEFFSSDLPPIDFSGRWRCKSSGGLLSSTELPKEFEESSRYFSFEKGSLIVTPGIMAYLPPCLKRIIEIAPSLNPEIFLLSTGEEQIGRDKNPDYWFVKGLKGAPQKLVVAWGAPLKREDISPEISEEEIREGVRCFAGAKFATAHIIYEKVGESSSGVK